MLLLINSKVLYPIVVGLRALYLTSTVEVEITVLGVGNMPGSNKTQTERRDVPERRQELEAGLAKKRAACNIAIL